MLQGVRLGGRDCSATDVSGGRQAAGPSLPVSPTYPHAHAGGPIIKLATNVRSSIVEFLRSIPP